MKEMLSRRYFPLLFKQFQKMLSRNEELERVLKVHRHPLVQLYVSDVYAISNLITTQIAELQKPHVEDFLQSFHLQNPQGSKGSVKKLEDIEYDQAKGQFIIRSRVLHPQAPEVLRLAQGSSQSLEAFDPQQERWISYSLRLHNCHQEKVDHPSIRKTLYFHQLKDMDKYVHFQCPPEIPFYVKQMNKKKKQMELLDKNNPLGIPKKAPPFVIDLNIEEKIVIRLQITYELTVIKFVGRTQKAPNGNSFRSRRISGMKIPSSVQKTLFNQLIRQTLLLDSQQMLNLHKLAYVGGRAEKLAKLLQVHETMCSREIEKFAVDGRTMI